MVMTHVDLIEKLLQYAEMQNTASGMLTNLLQI